MAEGPYSIGSSHWSGLSKLVEELGELQQVLGKLLGTGGETHHWDGSDLGDRLVDEIGDASAAIEFFTEKNMTPDQRRRITDRMMQKLELFDGWHDAGDPLPEPLVDHSPIEIIPVEIRPDPALMDVEIRPR